MNARGAPRTVTLFALALAACGGDTPPPPRCDAGVDCDVTLAPPARGLQLTVGPIDVPPGSEVLRCFWRKVPEDLSITEIEIAYNVGSHHLDLFTVDYAMPDGDFDCSDPREWGQWRSEIQKGLDPDSVWPRMLVGFQNDRIGWRLPEGVAYRVRAGQQILIQSHFANVATQNTPTKRLLDFINLHSTAAQPAQEAETLFDEDTELVLPPHATVERVRFCEFPSEVNLIGMFGHFHSRGTRFQVFSYDPATKMAGPLLYQNQTWSDPPWYTQDDWGGPRAVRGIMMVASYTNPTDRLIRWGSFVEENEHLETYAMFYPRLGVLAGCICYHDGEQPEYITHGRADLCAQ